MNTRRVLRKTITQIKNAWLVFGVTVLLLLVMEGVFALLCLIKTSSVFGTINPRVRADAYKNASWVHDYYKEAHLSGVIKWTPYVYWRRRPFQGTYINVDADGLRSAINSAAHQAETNQPRTIFMFGGSTLWGTGVRDRFTIPSILTAELESNERDLVRIVNFGESGYVSTQSVITLLLQLQKGHIPDMVVFYDGVNDTFSAYQQGAAGLPQNEVNRVREFSPSAGTMGLMRNILVNLSTTRFVSDLIRRLRRASFPSDPIADPLFVPDRRVDANSLAADVVATYRGNIEIVKALGRHYGFESLFYWQPVIFQKAHLTEYERAQQRSRHYLQRFSKETYNAMQQSGLAEEAGVHDISRMFAETQEPLYVDWCHLGESGNAAVAQRMARDVLSIIGRTE